ncbi:MAG TPA: ribose-5-phosphate isomerase RpiA [Thermoanaerobaculia bacterium]|nr:ribose-5-phosphate isomerase RpiA [Thermoanaerobaculia bacterium]
MKRRAGERAAALVASGMVVGLGTGSTAVFATRAIGERLASGALRDVAGVPTSRATAGEARRVGIPLLSDDIPREVDVTIDGADEVDPALDLIKGGGGALFREKIVAQASRRLVIVVDDSKLSPALGTRHALPVEVARFGWKSQERFLESIGGRPLLRLSGGGGPYETDQGNWILDCSFGPIADAPALARRLADRAGIVAHGLFCALATEVIVAAADGIRELKRL